MTLASDVAQLKAVFSLEDNASANVNKIKTGLGGMGSAGATAGSALGLVERGATGMGNALNHAKGFVGNLISGPLGFLGLTAGALSVAGAFKNGIDTANSMALSIEKLTVLTGEDAHSMSELLAVTGKFGITSDQLGTIVAFEEKTTGKLAETYVKTAAAGKSLALQQLEAKKNELEATNQSTKHIDVLIKEQKAIDALAAAHEKALPPINKLQALQKQYGVTLTDSKGRALDWSTVLNHVSDYYNSNASAGQEAALAATLYGRGFAAMIPVLQLGSVGFAKAKAAADSLGLTITDQNSHDLLAYQEHWRELGDAIGGLQLQLSLALLPTLNDLASAVTKFVTDHRTDITAFFKSAISTAREVGGALVGFGKQVASVWNAIPGPVKTLLLEALIGNKVIKTVFGINILGTVEGAIGNIIGQITGKVVAATVASKASDLLGIQKVFVVNMGPGGLGGLGGAAEDLGGAAAAAGGTAALGTASAIATAALLALPIAIPLLAEINHKPGDPYAPLQAKFNFPIFNNGATNGDGPAFANIAAAEKGQADAAKAGNAIAAKNWQTAINIWKAVQAADEQAVAHQASEKSIKEIAGSNHEFLTLFRTGSAKAKIGLFPAEYAYLSTASAETKKTAVFVSGVRQDITTLKHAQVGATDSEKAKLAADIVALQKLVAATTAAVYSVGLSPAQLTTLQNTKDKDSSLPVHVHVSTRDVNTQRVIKNRAGPDISSTGNR